MQIINANYEERKLFFKKVKRVLPDYCSYFFFYGKLSSPKANVWENMQIQTLKLARIDSM